MARPFCRQTALLCLTSLLSLAAACNSPAAGSDGGPSFPVGAKCHADSDCGGGTCLTSYPSGYCSADCTSNAQCPSGSTCTKSPEGQQQCLKDCTSVTDCRNGYACDGTSHVCLPGSGSTTPAAGAIGSACTQDSDCTAGPSPGCFKTPGGYCSSSCSSNTDCPNGTCVPGIAQDAQGNAVSACLENCSTSSDCRSGYACQTAQNGGVCIPACKADADCGSGYTCDTGSGLCQRASSGNTDPNYCAACQQDSDCGGTGNFCLAFSQGAATGNCGTKCSTDADCPASAVCQRILDQNMMPLGNACVPSNGMCPGGTTGGNADAGTTVPPHGTDGGTVTNGNVSINMTSLGPVVANGVPVGFTIPANAVSSYIVAWPPSGATSSQVALYSLTGPGGTIYNAGNQTNSYDAAPNENGSIGVMYPNAPPPRTTNNPYNLPGLNYTPGSYQAAFVNIDSRGNVTTGQTYNMMLLTKSVSGSLTGGTLDLNIWFDNSVMTAAQAQRDSSFQAMIQSARAIWSSIGITLGQVNYLNLPDSRGAYQNISGNGDEGALCAMTAGAPNDSLNWVLIDSISGGGGGGNVILGETAGLPGTPLRGTGASCVAVSMSLWGQMSPSDFAPIVVHESGHWLGLFHPTEAPGTMFDPLPDTPECASACDRNGDGQVDDLECSSTQVNAQCGGGTNLMFWLAASQGSAPHTHLTADQQFVILRHLAIQ